MRAKPAAEDAANALSCTLTAIPDHPTNRGTLCPKEAALQEFVRAPTWLAKPCYHAPGVVDPRFTRTATAADF